MTSSFATCVPCREEVAATKTSPLKVWLYDPLCFTPWYSAALAKGLISAGMSLRFLSAGVSREPEFFLRAKLTPAPGPFRFDRYVNGWPSAPRRIVRCAAAIANSLTLAHTIERYPADRPDIIHLQQMPLLQRNMQIDFRLVAAAQRSGIPVVHTVHNLLPHDDGFRSAETYHRLYRCVDHLICHSADIEEALRTQFGIPASSISVIPHGPLFESPSDTHGGTTIAARRQLHLPDRRPIVLWQGVMAPYKGLDVLLKAWELCASYWNFLPERPLLLIAGTGSHEVEAAVRFAEHAFPQDIRADIRYIPTSNLPLYYQAADLLVYPYHAITTSGALLTGLSYQKPIIASDLVPFREYLHHYDNAMLVKPGDAVALASALTQIIRGMAVLPDSPQEGEPENIYSRLLAGAQTNRRRYTGWDEIAQRTVAVYDRLILQKHTTGSVQDAAYIFRGRSSQLRRQA